jgi:hypothetical protein
MIMCAAQTDLWRVGLLSRPQLLNTCANYEAALMNMSHATAAFADAMQICSACVIICNSASVYNESCSA